jgi:hypothetical protein
LFAKSSNNSSENSLPIIDATGNKNVGEDRLGNKDEVLFLSEEFEDFVIN